MRLIAQGINAEFSSERLVPGGRRMAWRGLPCILRVRNDDTGSCVVNLNHGETGELIDTISLTGAEGKSGAEYQSPGSFTVRVASVTAPINVSIWVDGDTGVASAGLPGSGFDDGFDVGFGG